MDLLRPDHRNWDDRRTRAKRDLDEAATAQPLDPITVAVRLRGPFHAFRKYAHELVALEQRGCIFRVGQNIARLDQQHGGERHRKGPVHDEHASVTRVRMLREDRGPDHRSVVRNDARVVRDQKRATARGHVLHAVDFNPPILAVEPERDVLDALGEFGVKAEAIALEFQLAAGTHYAKGPHSGQLSCCRPRYATRPAGRSERISRLATT